MSDLGSHWHDLPFWALGLDAPLTIEADEPGSYWGQCTEYCGLSHSRMRMQVIALDAKVQVDFNPDVVAYYRLTVGQA